VDVLGAASGGGWDCRLGTKTFRAERAAPDVAVGGKMAVMARPESLRLGEPGAGYLDGTVRMNVYLGHSIECFVETPYGEVLAQIDDPSSKKVYPEGSPVSIGFEPDRIRVLADR